jgi:hypothetical protein
MFQIHLQSLTMFIFYNKNQFYVNSVDLSTLSISNSNEKTKLKLNSVAFSPQANYTDQAAAACRRS